MECTALKPRFLLKSSSICFLAAAILVDVSYLADIYAWHVECLPSMLTSCPWKSSPFSFPLCHVCWTWIRDPPIPHPDSTTADAAAATSPACSGCRRRWHKRILEFDSDSTIDPSLYYVHGLQLFLGRLFIFIVFFHLQHPCCIRILFESWGILSVCEVYRRPPCTLFCQ